VAGKKHERFPKEHSQSLQNRVWRTGSAAGCTIRFSFPAAKAPQTHHTAKPAEEIYSG